MGTSSVTGGQTIIFADNVSFDGTPRGGAITSDGQLLIGSSVAPYIRPGSLASSNSSIAITVGHGTINLAAGSSIATTYNGDTGSATPSSNTLTIKAGTSTQNSGSSVSISGSGATLTLNLTDSNVNTMIGSGSGGASISGSYNAAIGAQSLNHATTANYNYAGGQGALYQLTTGQYNLGIGYTCGFNYTSSESNNICINSLGVTGESNVLRIGSATGTGQQQLNKAFISGINGNTVSNTKLVTINSSTDQLGTVAYVSNSLNSVNVQTFTSNGTYTPTSGMKYCIIECVGGGGAGGGSDATGAGTISGGSGGAGGGYARGLFSSGTIGSSQTVTIGAGGTGSAGLAGGNGGTTSVGSLISAGGGNGGNHSGASNAVIANPGTSNVGSGGSINIAGNTGQVYFASTTQFYMISGNGGNSVYGAGGYAVNSTTANQAVVNGQPGTGYGAGGSGSLNSESNAGTGTGGNGSGGIVIITEYISS